MQPRCYNACPPVVSLQGFPRTPAVLQWLCLVKRSRALRGRNPTRNSQVKVRQGRVRPLVGISLTGGRFLAPWTPCDPSENPLPQNTMP